MDCSDSRTVESEKGTNNLVGGCQLQHSTTLASTGSLFLDGQDRYMTPCVPLSQRPSAVHGISEAGNNK